MLKRMKFMIVFSLIISLFIACEKDMEPVIPSNPNPTEKPDQGDGDNPEDPTIPEEPTTPEDPTTPEQPNENSIEVGTGSGSLTIDGSNAIIKGKNLIIVKAGTYGSINIKNVNGTIGNPVLIKNGGQVTVNGGIYTENIVNVTIAGDNTPGIQYGFNLHNISYRALSMSGKLSGVTLKSISFKNVKDHVIHINATTPYTGTAETRMERFKILNCMFDNTGGIQSVGHIDSGRDIGFMKDLEIAYNIIQNSSPGNFAYMGNIQDYDIHHNTINNLNSNNSDHNGIFHMIGNGKLHNNKFTNFQGNTIRAWLFSRGSTPSTVEIYNNIVYNTRQYSAFELQSFNSYLVSGKTTVANAKVYNNTVGKMDTSKGWEGVILDLYNYGGTLEYYNNLGYELHQTTPITDMINNMSDVKITKSNNVYIPSALNAVVDLNNFVSKISGTGAR